MKRKILGSTLGIIVFASGYFVSTVYSCTRINANCSYTVTSEICNYDGCDSCDKVGAPCC
jgi:hypothetical protein